MGRPRKTDRHEVEKEDARDDSRDDREAPRVDFENEMFQSDPQWAGHIPESEWPEGLAFRWISIEVTGAPDNKNWSLKTAAKWTPVMRGQYPKIDKRFPTVPMPGVGDRSDGAIIFGGLCLCQRDKRLTIRDKKLQEKATQDAGRTVESYVEGGNANFPRFNQSTGVQYERGARPAQFKE